MGRDRSAGLRECQCRVCGPPAHPDDFSLNLLIFFIRMNDPDENKFLL